MQTTVSVKRPGQMLAATGIPGQISSRLFCITDRNCGYHFLVDTGAEISVLPPSHAERKRSNEHLTLQAVNGSLIATYGNRSLTQELGLRRTFRWVFVIADIERPILGADFLRHFHLLVDMSHSRLVDSLTQLRIQGVRSMSTTLSPSLLPRVPANNFEALLLSEFPILTTPQPTNQPPKPTVTHHIETTGAPEYPPIRPIVAQHSSVLRNAGILVDHSLQGLAKRYPDYLANSFELVKALEDITLKHRPILVTMDVNSLYPQEELLKTIYLEMWSHTSLIPFDPNLIIHLCVNNNFFTFARRIFQQHKGTAMGAPFSPTVAMSVFFRCLTILTSTQQLLLKRYIDDIFFIWTDSKAKLEHFLTTCNTFHQCISFTASTSTQSVDFLDVTVSLQQTGNGEWSFICQTYQKPLNLYQYVHATSYAPRSQLKALITCECIRYARTCTNAACYYHMVTLFTQRLTRRGYRLEDIQKYTSTIQHSVRELPPKQKHTLSLVRPIIKCLSVPNPDQLKRIILNNFLNHFPKPLMCFLKHRKIKASLVSSKTGDCTPEHINNKVIPLQSTSQAVPLPKPVPHSKSLGFTPCHKHSCRLCPHTYKCT